MKKILCFAVALAMLIATLISCVNNEGNKGDDTTTASNETENNLYVADYLPDEKFGGKDFRVLTYDESSVMYTTFDADIDTKNKVLAAQYKRNRLIEDRYDIVFKEDLVTDIWDLSDAIVSYVDSMDNEYELNMLIQREAFSKACEGYVVRTSSLTYCDPTQPWYVHDVNDELSMNGITFFTYTDECLNLFAQTDCILFNERIIDDSEGLENPYDLVEKDEWTIDKFFESAAAARNDLNGNQLFDEGDQLGIVAEGDVLYPSLWIGAGQKTIEKNKQDYPEYKANKNEELIGILTRMQDFLKDGTIFDTSSSSSDMYGDIADQRLRACAIFQYGNSLYRVAMIGKIAELGDMEDDFGIVPCPKYDEDQEEYMSRSCDGWIYVVPVTNEDYDMTSIVLEELGVESKNYVYDAYYQETLKDRYTRDTEGRAVKMLDLISSTRTIDLGDTVWQEYARNKVLDTIWSLTNKFSSELKAIEKLCTMMIKSSLTDLALDN